MKTNEEKSVIFLFTKRFPYGHQEVYLENEINILSKRFYKVILIPFDEYDYLESEQRSLPENFNIFKLNKNIPVINIKEKIKREIIIYYYFIISLIFEREKRLHYKKRKNIIATLRHCYSSSIALHTYIKNNSFTKFIFYNYWLHRGSIISHFYNLKYKKTKSISRAHSFDLYHKDWETIFYNGNKLFLPFELLKIKHTDKIFSISKHGKMHLDNVFPKYKNKFEISYLGVQKQVTNINNAQKKIKIIVSCSSIQELKRVYLIPEILSRLEMPFEWHHFGWKKSESDLIKVKNEIIKHNLQDKSFLHGNTKNSEVLNFYKKNNPELFINVSTAEGLPVAIMEAFSLGIPALATNIVGVPEIVNNKNGFLVDVNFSPDRIGERINEYLKNEHSILIKRKESLRTFNSKFNAEINYNNFIDKIINE